MRLFIAIDIPEAWRDEADRVRGALTSRFGAELRPVARAQLHLTLRFLGEVSTEQTQILTRAVEDSPPFAVDLALDGTGTFGSSMRPSVLWLGVAIEESQRRQLLAVADCAIREAGLATSEAAWTPHVTLARVRRQVGPERGRELAEAMRDLPAPAPHPFTARSLSLYQSDLEDRAPRHKLLARSAVS